MLYSQSLVLNCARLPIDAMYNKFITRIADRMPCLAQKREGKEPLSLIFVYIGRLMPLEIVQLFIA